ncbi:MAG: hypothetical protein ACM3PP_03585 [Candidatus Saccharibacteria bacterium]
MASRKYLREIKPPGKPIKRFMLLVLLFCLGRGFQRVAKWDPDVKKEVEAWKEGFSIMFEVNPNGPYMSLRKQNGKIKYLGLYKTDAQLIINFKNIDSAFLVFTAQMGTPRAYAEHRVSVKGDLQEAMRLIRCLNYVQFYLFPAIIAKNVMKRLPPIPFGRLMGGRTLTYLFGVPLGL